MFRVHDEFRSLVQLLGIHISSITLPVIQTWLQNHTVRQYLECFFDHHQGIHTLCQGDCTKKGVKEHYTDTWKKQMEEVKTLFFRKLDQ